jgi:hypothetical protein
MSPVIKDEKIICGRTFFFERQTAYTAFGRGQNYRPSKSARENPERAVWSLKIRLNLC